MILSKSHRLRVSVLLNNIPFFIFLLYYKKYKHLTLESFFSYNHGMTCVGPGFRAMIFSLLWIGLIW